MHHLKSLDKIRDGADLMFIRNPLLDNDPEASSEKELIPSTLASDKTSVFY